MKKLQSSSALLTLLVVGFVSLFAVGCGDSRENFVFTGTNNPANTGSLVFEFQQEAVPAQTVIAPDFVPAGTTTLRFDFFTTDPAAESSFLFTETRAFAPEIVFNNVSTEARSVLVTAFDDNGLPLATLAGSVSVTPGTTTRVNLNDSVPVALDALTVTPDPVILTEGQTQQLTFTGSFNQGSTADIPGNLGTFTFNEGANLIPTANITAGGLVGFVNQQQNSTLTSSFTLGGQTRTDDVLVRTVVFDATGAPSNLLNVTNAINYDVEFFDSDGVTALLNLNVAATTSYALQSGPAGVTVNSTNGVITVPSEVNSGTVVVRVTWVDGRNAATNPLATGRTFTDDVTFNIAVPAQSL